ncbi:MAG: SUMF1/EgtB/PvdO family nonheme iron enzyme [Planctomycetes bacterium]|nr:SUMF1/EgtB/PvdO family nonheme iron enzyme [Planctomycetota bacterium]
MPDEPGGIKVAGGYLRAALMGLVEEIPLVGKMVVRVVEHHQLHPGRPNDKLERSVRKLMTATSRGDPVRTQALAALPEPVVTEAVREASHLLSAPERTRIERAAADAARLPAAVAPEAFMNAVAEVLASSPAVRHSLLSRAHARSGRPAPLPRGEVIDGRFEIEEFLGEGGMGVVYRAHDRRFESHVALKLLSRDLVQDEAAKTRFRKEVSLGLRLSHPNIVRVHDLGEVGGQLYMHMELVDGSTLRALLGDGPLPVPRALEIARGFLGGLAHAHKKNVLHLDVKPENILLGPEGYVALGDFGLARALGGDAFRSLVAGAGTPYYMAPEQLKGDRELDTRADVFAAGMVLYEMFTGEPAMGAFEPLPDEVPPILRAAVQQALSQRREKRPPDAMALLESVAAAIASSAASPASPAPIVVVAPPSAPGPAEELDFAFVSAPPPSPPAPLPAAFARPAPPVEAPSEVILRFPPGHPPADEGEKTLVDLPPDPATFIDVTRISSSVPGACPAKSDDEATVVDPPWTDLVLHAPPKVTSPPPAGKRLPPLLSAPASNLTRSRRNEQGFDEFVHERTGLVLVQIPRGESWMGSDDGAKPETPVHPVALRAYLIGKHEVTNAQYRAFCRETGHAPPPPPLDGWGYTRCFEDSKYDNHPVVNVAWQDAVDFCAWAGLRLPTEAEWEKSASWDERGGRARTYPWGEEAPTQRFANFGKAKGRGEYTRGVTSCPAGASAYGVVDLAGNVWEWCADWYDEGYYASCGDGTPNPAGPATGTMRVVRGGSWLNSDRYLRCAYRNGRDPLNWYILVGFRVAAPVP